MLSKESKDLAIRALWQIRGDDLERATAAFKNCDPDVMNAEYGDCGKTRQEVLDAYRADRKKIDDAICELEIIFQEQS